MGSLLVTVVEGRDLLGMDRGGKYSDPYATFELNGERVFKTQVIKKTLVRRRRAEVFKLTRAERQVEREVRVLGRASIQYPARR